MQPHKMSAKQTNNESVLKFVCVLIVLSLINLLFFYLYWNKEAPALCMAESVVHAAVKYLISKGNVSLAEATPKECPQVGTEVREEFVKAVQLINRGCQKHSLLKLENVASASKPLITLFTTFSSHVHNDTEKYLVHNNTINNWASLKPDVNLILFTNDSEIKQIVKDAGWDLIVAANETSERPPVLKDLFLTAMNSFNTPWYGYANGDILFMDDFINTIKEINDIFGADKRVLVTGRRTNVENLTSDIDATDFTELRKFALEHGQLYKTDAEDFFVTSRVFPWNDTLPVVIGRPAYDNWLSGHARCALKSIVIDVTETVVAIHQTTSYGGNIESYKSQNPYVNFELFKQLNLKPNFIAGLTTCTNYKTFNTFCGVVTADERLKQEKGCACS